MSGTKVDQMDKITGIRSGCEDRRKKKENETPNPTVPTYMHLGGVGAKTLFLFAWCACWILIPYASVSGKKLFKF